MKSIREIYKVGKGPSSSHLPLLLGCFFPCSQSKEGVIKLQPTGQTWLTSQFQCKACFCMIHGEEHFLHFGRVMKNNQRTR